MRAKESDASALLPFTPGTETIPPAEARRDERSGIVVVDIEPEHRDRRVCHLHVPVVRGHEKLAAMFGIVVPVRPERVLRHQRPPACWTWPGLERVDFRMQPARERQRLDHAYELAPADSARAGDKLRDIYVDWTAPHQVELHRHERHFADRTLASFVVDDLRVHRAGPGSRRQPPPRDCKQREHGRQKIAAPGRVDGMARHG